MFYDREDCIKISYFPDDYGTQSGVFLFKGFYTDEECKVIENAVSPKIETNSDVYKDTLINWYADKTSPPIPGILALWEKASELLYPEYVMHPQQNVLVVTEDHEAELGMFIHSDSPGKNKCELLSQIDVWRTCCSLDFGLVAYFGDFEGGEVFYININKDGNREDAVGLDDHNKALTVKPERGDLIIHGAFSPHAHGVKKVTKGARYAFANFILKAEDNPGTFHNYKTPEYLEQIEKDYYNWGVPLKENPQFTRERIKQYKASGLEGTELADAFPYYHND